MKLSDLKHPDQPVGLDSEGVARADAAVERLLAEEKNAEPPTLEAERNQLRVSLSEAQGELRHLRSVLEELADICKNATEDES